MVKLSKRKKTPFTLLGGPYAGETIFLSGNNGTLQFKTKRFNGYYKSDGSHELKWVDVKE